MASDKKNKIGNKFDEPICDSAMDSSSKCGSAIGFLLFYYREGLFSGSMLREKQCQYPGHQGAVRGLTADQQNRFSGMMVGDNDRFSVAAEAVFDQQLDI